MAGGGRGERYSDLIWVLLISGIGSREMRLRGLGNSSLVVQASDETTAIRVCRVRQLVRRLESSH